MKNLGKETTPFSPLPSFASLLFFCRQTMAQPQGTQGSSRVGFGAPLMKIANLYGTIPSASTPSTKDLGPKETISPIVAQFAQVLAEHLKGTMAAQTPGNITNTVPETPDSAIVSSGPTSQTRESSFLCKRITGSGCGSFYCIWGIRILSLQWRPLRG